MTTTTSEPQRSGPGTPPVVGMVVRYCTGDHGWRTITEVEGRYPRMSRREDGKLLAMTWSGWDAGEYEIASPAPAKQPAPVDAHRCKGAPCGMNLDDRVAYGHLNRSWYDTIKVGQSIIGDDDRIYCSSACRDAAKAKARECEGAPCGSVFTRHEDVPTGWRWTRPEKNVIGYCSVGCLDEARARREARTKPAPQPAPWRCIGEDCTTPNAPQFTKRGGKSSQCVACQDRSYRALMNARDESFSTWLAARGTGAMESLASPLLPGSAHALAVAGARTWRRPTSYVPLDLPGMED